MFKQYQHMLYYIALLSGYENINDQHRNPNSNERDHLTGLLKSTKGLPNIYLYL